jgi:murein DD-endopeptidase MepM/ murein hydrolase activator NlpD
MAAISHDYFTTSSLFIFGSSGRSAGPRRHFAVEKCKSEPTIAGKPEDIVGFAIFLASDLSPTSPAPS